MFNEIVDLSRKTKITLWAVDDDGTKRKIVISAQFPKDTAGLDVGIQIPFDNGTLATIEQVEQLIKQGGGTITPGGGGGGDTFTKTEITALLRNKANANDVYTKAAIDDALAKKVSKDDITNLVTMEQLTKLLTEKADAVKAEVLAEVEEEYATKRIPELTVGKSYQAGELAFKTVNGNTRLVRVVSNIANYDGKTGAFATIIDSVSLGDYPLIRPFIDGQPLVKTSTYLLNKDGLYQSVIDNKNVTEADLANTTKFIKVFEFSAGQQVDLADYFTKDEVTAELDKKLNITDAYTKEYLDNEFNKKANQDNVYIKSEIDDKFKDVKADGAAMLAEANTFTEANTFNGAVALTSATITAAPTAETDVVNKKYVDEKTNAETGNFTKLAVTEGTVDTVGTEDNSIVNKKFVEDQIKNADIDGKIKTVTETITNNKTEADNKFDIINAKISPDASADNQLADKKYVTDTVTTTVTAEITKANEELKNSVDQVKADLATTDGNVTTNSNDIAEIKSKIPTAASETNQLADKAFVEETIANGTGAYITKDENGAEFATNAELVAGPYFSKGKTRKLKALDWTIVLADETHDGATAHYGYDGANWVFKFKIENQPFTQAQLDAINSGATKALIDKIDDKASLTEANTFAGENTFTGTITVPSPTENGHAVNKAYVDAKTDQETGNFTKLAITEGTVTKEPTDDIDMVNKKYVDAKDALKANITDVFTKDEVTTKLDEKANTADVYTKAETYSQIEVDEKIKAIDVADAIKGVAKLGEANEFTNINTFTGAVTLTSGVITTDPVNDTDIANKKYVDDKIVTNDTFAKLAEDNNFTGTTNTFTGSIEAANGKVTNTFEDDTSIVNRAYMVDKITATKTELAAEIDKKANSVDVYTKTETMTYVNDTINDKIDNFDHTPYAKVDAANTFTKDNTFEGAVIVPTPTETNHAVTKAYVDAKTDVETGNFTKIAITEGTVTTTPANDTDIVNKKYVDDMDKLKADVATTYSKDEVDAKLGDYYTKTQTEEKITEVNQAITEAKTASTTNAEAITKLEEKITENNTTSTEAVDELKKLIPTEATETNQLADKAYVSESISKMSAFLVSADEKGAAFANKATLLAGPYFSKGVEYTPANHDYAIVLEDEDKENATTQYMYDGAVWNFQHKIESAPFTQAQLDAINSTATAETIAKITTNETAITGLSGRLDTLEKAQTDSAGNKVDKAGDTMTGGLNIELADTGTALKAQADTKGFKVDVVKDSGNLNLIPVDDVDNGFVIEYTAIKPRGTTSTLGDINNKYQAVYTSAINDIDVTTIPTIDDTTTVDDTKVWSAKKVSEALGNVSVAGENYIKHFIVGGSVKQGAYVLDEESVYKAIADSDNVTKDDLTDGNKFTNVYKPAPVDLTKFEPYRLPFTTSDLNVITTKTKDNFTDVLTVDGFKAIFDVVKNDTRADLRDSNGKNKIVYADYSETDAEMVLKLNLAGPFWQFGSNGFTNGLILMVLKLDTATNTYSSVEFESSCSIILSQADYDAITTKSDYVLYHITAD